MRYLSHQCREPFFNILMWFFFARIHISKGYREVKSSFQLGDQLNDLNIIRKNNFPYLCLESQNRNMKGSPWEKKIFVATCQFGFLKVFTVIFSLLSQPLRDWSSLLIYEYTNHASRHGGQRKKIHKKDLILCWCVYRQWDRSRPILKRCICTPVTFK